MSQSNLVTYTAWSPYYGYGGHGRGGNAIENIVVHHMAGNLSVQQCGRVFKNAGASTHYGVNGKSIGQYVREEDAAWACGSKWWNQNSISIELANDGGASTGWHVSDETIRTAIKLITDICRRNGIKRLIFTGDKWGNLIMHKWLASTACPGPYLAGKFPYITEEVNKILQKQKKKEGFVKEAEKYYLYENGVKRTKKGWYDYKGKRVYVKSDKSLKHYCHTKIDGKIYVFAKAEPRLCRNITATIRGKWFKSDKNGVVVRHQFWGKVYSYKQGDYSKTKVNGCHPTTMAMVVSSLIDKKIEPPEVTALMEKKGAWTIKGSAGGHGTKLVAKEYGLKYKYFAAAEWEKALEFMRKREALTVVRVEKGAFTDGIHFLAITDVDKNHNVYVHNPGAKGANGNYRFDKYIAPYLRDQRGDRTAATNGAMCVIYK